MRLRKGVQHFWREKNAQKICKNVFSKNVNLAPSKPFCALSPHLRVDAMAEKALLELAQCAEIQTPAGDGLSVDFELGLENIHDLSFITADDIKALQLPMPTAVSLAMLWLKETQRARAISESFPVDIRKEEPSRLLW